MYERSVGGPPIVLYLLTVSNDVRRYTASVQAWFAVTEVFLLGNKITDKSRYNPFPDNFFTHADGIDGGESQCEYCNTNRSTGISRHMSIAILLLVTFIATAIHTSTSFGFGIITIMVFPLLMPTYSWPLKM